MKRVQAAIATAVAVVAVLAFGLLSGAAAAAGNDRVFASQPVPTTTATTLRAATTVAPVPTTTAVPATRTRHVVPGWMWVLIGLSVFTNLLILGALLNSRLRPPPPARPAIVKSPDRHPSQF